MTASILVFGIGNDSRGDDALGPFLLRGLASGIDPEKVGLLEVYQLQVEHILDMDERDCVIFIDASIDAAPPFEMREILPKKDFSHTTHALSPQTLLYCYGDILKKDAPSAYLLGVKGVSFDLGAPLSIEAQNNLGPASVFIKDFIGLKCGFGKAGIPG